MKDGVKITSPVLPAPQAKFKVLDRSTSELLRKAERAYPDSHLTLGVLYAEANRIKEYQDRLQAKLMLVQLSLDADSTAGFERAAETFKEVNQFPDFNLSRSALSLKVTTYGYKNEVPIISPAPSSFWSTVEKMCRANCEETFRVSGMLEKKETRLWATFVAVQIGLRESSKELKIGLR